MAKRQPKKDVSIGKFEILATYACAKGLLDGLSESKSKERAMVAAIMGANARLGHQGSSQDHQVDKQAAEKKKEATITAESFDRQVADKMGGFFGKTFLPAMKKLMAVGLVRRGEGGGEDPQDLGAKITGEQFVVRAAAALPEVKKR